MAGMSVPNLCRRPAEHRREEMDDRGTFAPPIQKSSYCTDMRADDSVLNYDHNHYVLKSFDRPLACLPSSEAALFHNPNTGADGVLSCLALIAP